MIIYASQRLRDTSMPIMAVAWCHENLSASLPSCIGSARVHKVYLYVKIPTQIANFKIISVSSVYPSNKSWLSLLHSHLLNTTCLLT